MSYLLRVELPDVPGSLGRVATAIGHAGGNIEAIEIVEHGLGDSAVDDVFVRAEQGVMPDAIVSALHGLDGVQRAVDFEVRRWCKPHPGSRSSRGDDTQPG
ncbi:MAG: ACT domain-containing protein [Marmoricola sp.]